MRGTGGSLDWRTAAAVETVRVSVRTMIDWYRMAESAVVPLATRTVLQCLRRDHERQLAELERLLYAGEAPADGGRAGGPVARAIDGGQITPDAVLPVVLKAERDLRTVQDRAIAACLAEPIRAVLARHRAIGEAHVEWLEQSRGLGLRDVA